MREFGHKTPTFGPGNSLMPKRLQEITSNNAGVLPVGLY